MLARPFAVLAISAWIAAPASAAPARVPDSSTAAGPTPDRGALAAPPAAGSPTAPAELAERPSTLGCDGVLAVGRMVAEGLGLRYEYAAQGLALVVRGEAAQSQPMAEGAGTPAPTVLAAIGARAYLGGAYVGVEVGALWERYPSVTRGPGSATRGVRSAGLGLKLGALDLSLSAMAPWDAVVLRVGFDAVHW